MGMEDASEAAGEAAFFFFDLLEGLAWPFAADALFFDAYQIVQPSAICRKETHYMADY
jgi:hypothetical protein